MRRRGNTTVQWTRASSACARGLLKITTTAAAGMPVARAISSTATPRRASFSNSRWAPGIMTLRYKTGRGVSRDIFSKQNAALAGAPPARLAVRQADGVSRIEKYRFSAWRRQHFSCQIEAKTPLGGIHYIVV